MSVCSDLFITWYSVCVCFQDNVIAKESAQYKITGGCTALVALFFMGKLYVANAGDCR